MNPHRRVLCPIVLCCCTSLSAVATAAGQSADTMSYTPAHSAAGPAGGLSAADALRPGDVVRLRIWREPDLSGDFAVDESGRVVFPLIGEMQVSRLSTDSLKTAVAARYARYLRNPSVEITTLHRVAVLGEVREPGLFPVDPTMKVADLLALAGGVTPRGNKDRVDVIRHGQRLPTSLSRQVLIGELPLQPGDQLFVPERSWLSRNTPIVTALIGTMTSITILLLR